jgi:lipopolysaccharide transport system ATP-binding protein
MSHIAIRAENLSKAYQLGEFSTGTLTRDIQRKIALMRGKEDPYLKIGETNDRTVKGGGSDIVWSLKDINFDINQGDAVGIIGRNGAGKSTLLKVLSRVTTPTTGSVKIKGRVASLLEVGTGFHPELTGRENIFLNGAILGMRKHEIKKHFDAIVDFAGVERYIDTPVKRYSSGMYVRLAFAVAAHLESEILIVDEVLAVGDAEFQKKCLGKMNDVSKGEGRTVLFVSHNMSSIQNLCSKGIMLKNGQVFNTGDTESVLNAYQMDINSNSSSITLTKERQGAGDLRVSNISFTNSDSEPISGASGSEFFINLKTQSNPNLIGKNLEIVIGINDELGNRIAVLGNKFINQPIVIKEANDFRFRLNKLPLIDGYYGVVVYTATDGEIQDWIQNAGSFLVEGGDYYNSGKKPNSQQGKILLDYDVY